MKRFFLVLLVFLAIAGPAYGVTNTPTPTNTPTNTATPTPTISGQTNWQYGPVWFKTPADPVAWPSWWPELKFRNGGYISNETSGYLDIGATYLRVKNSTGTILTITTNAAGMPYLKMRGRTGSDYYIWVDGGGDLNVSITMP